MGDHAKIHTPCADGCYVFCGGGDLGLDCHDIQIHQVIEEEMKDTAVCGDKTYNTKQWKN